MARSPRRSGATGARHRQDLRTRGLAGPRGPATGAARRRAAAAGRHRHRRLPSRLSRSCRRAGAARTRRSRGARRRVDSAVPQQDLSELHDDRDRAVAGAPRHRRQHDGRSGDRPPASRCRSRRPQRSALVAGRADLGRRRNGRAAAPPGCSGRATTWRSAGAGRPRGRASTTTSRTRSRVDRVLEWFAGPPAERPALAMLYFSLVDEAVARRRPRLAARRWRRRAPPMPWSDAC